MGQNHLRKIGGEMSWEGEGGMTLILRPEKGSTVGSVFKHDIHGRLDSSVSRLETESTSVPGY